MQKAFLLLVLSTHALAACSADLLEVYQKARTGDAIFRSAQDAYKADLEKFPQARSLLLPRVNLSANDMGNDVSIQYQGSNIFEAGASRFNSKGYVLSLTQPLFRIDNWERYMEAQLQVTLADSRYRMASQDLILRVSQAYFDVLEALDDVKLAEIGIDDAKAKLEKAKSKLQMRTGSTDDAQACEASLELAKANEIGARGDLEIKERLLQKISGIRQDELVPLQRNPGIPADNWLQIDKWLDAARHNNLNLIAARASLAVADKEVARHRGAHYPTVDLVASTSRSTAGSSMLGAGVGTEMTGNAIGVELNLPIFEGGAIQSQIRESEANRSRAMDDLDNIRENVDIQTRRAYLGVADGIARVKALEMATHSSENSLKAMKLAREAGIRDNVDVLDAKVRYVSSCGDLDMAKYRFLMSQLQLKASVADLSEADLYRINRLFH